MTKIVCRQLAPETGNLAANRQLANHAIEQSIDAAADVVIPGHGPSFRVRP